MNYKWQGSDFKKLNILKNLYENDLAVDNQVSYFSNEQMPLVHICNSIPPKDAILWYIQNNQSDNINELTQYYSNIKQNNNIKYVIIKDASYSPIYGYIHILLNQHNRVIYLRNEHEIDSYVSFLLIEEKIDASS